MINPLAHAQASCDNIPVQSEIDRTALPFTSAPLRASGHVYLAIDAGTAYQHVTGALEMPAWIEGVDRATYDNSTSQVPGEIGVGSLRSLDIGGRPDEERVVIVEPNTRFAYMILAGPPLKDHLAIMNIQPVGEGVIFSWYQYFNSKGGFGSIGLKRRVQRFVSRSQDNLSGAFAGRNLGQC